MIFFILLSMIALYLTSAVLSMIAMNYVLRPTTDDEVDKIVRLGLMEPWFWMKCSRLVRLSFARRRLNKRR